MEESVPAGFACFLKETNKGQKEAEHRSKVCSFIVINSDCLPWLLHSEIPSSTVLQIMAAHSCWVPDLGSLISIQPQRSADRRELLQWRAASFGSLRWFLWSLVKCFLHERRDCGPEQRGTASNNCRSDRYLQVHPQAAAASLCTKTHQRMSQTVFYFLMGKKRNTEQSPFKKIHQTTAHDCSARQEKHTCKRFA